MIPTLSLPPPVSATTLYLRRAHQVASILLQLAPEGNPSGAGSKGASGNGVYYTLTTFPAPPPLPRLTCALHTNNIPPGSPVYGESNVQDSIAWQNVFEDAISFSSFLLQGQTTRIIGYQAVFNNVSGLGGRERGEEERRRGEAVEVNW